MIRINSIPLGLGNVFENRKMYYIVAPCNGYNPTQGSNNLELSESWNSDCGSPKVEPVRPGVAYTADGENVFYYPLPNAVEMPLGPELEAS